MVMALQIASAEDFVRLRTSEDPDEYRVAANGIASDEVWLDVISRYPEMKEWVAHNKTVPLVILEKLLADADPGVRSVVATKRKLADAMFEKLASDPEVSVRLALSYNAKLPSRLIEQLKRDPESAVREALNSRVTR